MLILPLKFVREDDKKTIGLNLYHLAKLGHLGLPVVESVIIVPPVNAFENALHIILRPHVNIKDHLGNIKSQIEKIPVPENLRNFDSLDIFKEKTKMSLSIDKLWSNLLSKWSSEIISRIERGEKKVIELTPQLVIFSANFTVFGHGYFDEDRGHAVIKTEQGQLNFASSQAIENIIIVGNKKLLLPQIYYWGIEDNKIKIVKVVPYTQSLESENKIIEEPPAKTDVIKTPTKTATKIYLDYKESIINEFNFDGVILNIKKPDNDLINDKLAKISVFTRDAKFIFFPDYDPNLYSPLDFAKTFIFFKNKKKLDAQICLPEISTVSEYLQVKRDFASLGIYSKGTLKIWKQFTTVSDFLNFDKYLEAGFDGAVIDIDKIAKIVTGLPAAEILQNIKLEYTDSIIEFFKQMKLNKFSGNLKPVLIKGNLLVNEELINYFIKSGIWGLGFENRVSSGIRDHISFLEKLSFKSK